MANEHAPTHITYNPVYQVTYEGADPMRGHVYVRSDTRPAPAATDTGLVTAELRQEIFELAKDLFWRVDGNQRLWSSEEREVYGLRAAMQIARSQAVELLAAERAEKEKLERQLSGARTVVAAAQVILSENKKREADNAAKRAEKGSVERIRDFWFNTAHSLSEQIEKLEAELDFIGRVKGVNEKYANALAFLEMTENDDPEEFAECFWNKFIALEADNAAKDARIKELEWKAHNAALSNKIGEDSAPMLWSEYAEALEAKLAAAEKALEPFSYIAGELFAANFNNDDVVFKLHRKTAKGSKLSYQLTAKAFFEARAVLGGKPS